MFPYTTSWCEVSAILTQCEMMSLIFRDWQEYFKMLSMEHLTHQRWLMCRLLNPSTSVHRKNRRGK